MASNGVVPALLEIFCAALLSPVDPKMHRKGGQALHLRKTGYRDQCYDFENIIAEKHEGEKLAILPKNTAFRD
jgi:hypothetical protein